MAALVVAYLVGRGLGAAPGQRGASLPDEPVMVVVVKSHEDIAAVRVKLAARQVPRGAPGSGEGGGGGGLAALYAKPTLTLDEALLALQLIE